MTIRHRNGAYEVRFISLSEALAELPDTSFVITDQEVANLYGAAIRPGVPVHAVTPGEGSKTAETYLDSIHWLAANGAQRDAVVVALGGGVVGDLAGFAAATYMRGVAYLQIPTTLLAQVDSSVGGKVGVDLAEGKNMLGAFHPPTEVRVAIEALSTLPPRQYANGMAEVLKYGFIMAPEILEMARHRGQLESLVRRCIECKREVVEADELETTGRRAILNFGHSVGHALELLTGYSDLLHGEAISIGMCVEVRLSEKLRMSPAGTYDIVSSALKEHSLPITHPLLSQGRELVKVIRRDKKSSGGQLAFSLLRGIGNCELVRDVPEQDVMSVLGD